MRTWDLWPIQRDICLQIALFWSIRRWFNGRSLGTGKCHPRASLAMGGHRCDTYFQDSVLGERRYHHGPGRLPDLCRPGLLRFYLKADSLAFNVFEYSLAILMASLGWMGWVKKVNQPNVCSEQTLQHGGMGRGTYTNREA